MSKDSSPDEPSDLVSGSQEDGISQEDGMSKRSSPDEPSDLAAVSQDEASSQEDGISQEDGMSKDSSDPSSDPVTWDQFGIKGDHYLVLQSNCSH